MAGGKKRDLASLLGTGGGKKKTASSGSGGSILERARAAAETAKRAKTDATNGDGGEGAAVPSAGGGRAADARNAAGPASTSAPPGGQRREKSSRWDADAPRDDDALAKSRWANETDDVSPEASDSASARERAAAEDARRDQSRGARESYMDKMVREAAEFKMRQVEARADADAPGVGPPISRSTASVNVAAIMAMRTPSSDGDATPRNLETGLEVPRIRDSGERTNARAVPDRGDGDATVRGLDDLDDLEDEPRDDDDQKKTNERRTDASDDDDDPFTQRPARSPSPERAAIPSDEDDGSSDDEKKNAAFEEDEDAPHAPRVFDSTLTCRSVFDFEQLNKIDEGTYGVVFRARDKQTGKIYALKKVKMEKEREGFPMTALREANILLSMHHPNVVDVSEMVVGNSLDSVFMVMEFCEHDLKGLMETRRVPFSVPEVKCLMAQLFAGVAYMHENWTLHRDLKTSNVLVNNKGQLKICDFGLARHYGEPLGTYTPTVVTLWYRAPELLLGAPKYGPAIDVWSLGCIMAELLASEPLFTGKTEIDQLGKMFATLGVPTDTVWPGFKELPGTRRVNLPTQPYNHLRRRFPGQTRTGGSSSRGSGVDSFGEPNGNGNGKALGPDGTERSEDDTRHTPAPLSDVGFDLLNRLLAYDPTKRLTAEEASTHAFFAEFPPAKKQRLMPTYPSRAGGDVSGGRR
jgi:cell division cycle 2-like protein